MSSLTQSGHLDFDRCTIFTVALGEKVLFGNNEDNQRSPDETFIAFVPQQEIPRSWSTPGIEGNTVIHGFMLVGVIEGNKLLPQGGVNDRGFCYDINGLPPVHFNGQSGTSWRNQWFNSFDILWHCGTVKEAHEWYLTHQFSSQMWYGGQHHFADATGDAMVLSIGPSGDYIFTWKENADFLLSTNFNLANLENGYHPCNRYDTATQMLQNLDVDSLTIEACTDILDAVHIEYKNENGTVYSNIFDLVKRKAYIYHLHDFSKVMEFNLDEELSQIKAETADDRFTMVGNSLFSQFKGVRVHVIEDLFMN